MGIKQRRSESNQQTLLISTPVDAQIQDYATRSANVIAGDEWMDERHEELLRYLEKIKHLGIIPVKATNDSFPSVGGTRRTKE